MLSMPTHREPQILGTIAILFRALGKINYDLKTKTQASIICVIGYGSFVISSHPFNATG